MKKGTIRNFESLPQHLKVTLSNFRQEIFPNRRIRVECLIDTISRPILRFGAMRLLSFFLLCSLFSLSQVPGATSFAFLNSSFSARSMALGGKVVSVYDNDLSLVNENPALLNEKMHGHLHVNQSLLPSGIHFSALNYAHHTKFGTFAPSIRFVNYGSFTETDETGRQIGNQ